MLLLWSASDLISMNCCILCLQVHAASSPSQRTLVLLDAAAYLPTHELNLTTHPADFVVASFYKMFGYPTGLGVLVLRTEHVPQLNKVSSTYALQAWLSWIAPCMLSRACTDDRQFPGIVCCAAPVALHLVSQGMRMLGGLHKHSRFRKAAKMCNVPVCLPVQVYFGGGSVVRTRHCAGTLLHKARHARCGGIACVVPVACTVLCLQIV
jgi:hypothetical protein